MAYVSTNWSAGDTITSAKLNNIESGIASLTYPVFVVDYVYNDSTGQESLNATWNEIHSKYTDGDLILLLSQYRDSTYNSVMILRVNNVYEDNGVYKVSASEADFETDDINGYPTYVEQADT